MTQLALHIEQPWLPDNFKLSALSEEQLRVYEQLRYHTGAERAITVERLALLAFSEETASTRQVRDILKTLTEEKKIAIASNAHGVYLITDADELLTYTNNLTSRAMSILRRAASLKKISLPVFLGQLKQNFEKEEAA